MDDVRITGGWDAEGNRRVKVLYLGYEHVLGAVVRCLTETADLPRYRLRLASGGIDLTGATVVAVGEDFCRRAFGFMLHHPSFDPVPEGYMVPDFEGSHRWEWEVVDTRPGSDEVPVAFTVGRG